VFRLSTDRCRRQSSDELAVHTFVELQQMRRQLSRTWPLFRDFGPTVRHQCVTATAISILSLISVDDVRESLHSLKQNVLTPYAPFNEQ
jgi:hypothetical protein